VKISRAKHIVDALVRHHLSSRVDVDAPGLDELRELSLDDMVRANRLVVSLNRRQMAAKRKPGKGVRIRTTLDDRLTAAVYVSLHYQPSESDCLTIAGGGGLFLMPIRRAAGGDS
jgi:hypothetical protein